jgi:hypothetical protein
MDENAVQFFDNKDTLGIGKEMAIVVYKLKYTEFPWETGNA